MKTKVSILKCGNYDPLPVQKAVKEAVDLLGGVEKFIKAGSKVLIKPNVLMAKPPEAGITTHPEVVRGVIKVLKGIHCRILVGDSPGAWGKYIENVDEVYRVSGMKRVCAEERVELVSLENKRMRKDFPLTGILDQCDYVVNLPKFKTHFLMLLSGAIKNLFGLVSGSFKVELHKRYIGQDDFAKVLVDIYQEVNPALTVVDGIVAMEGDGPGTAGRLRHPGLILAGSDGVAIDSILASLMGIKPLDVLTTKEAGNRGLGQANLGDIELVGAKSSGLNLRPFILPPLIKKLKLAEPLLNVIKGLITFYPFVARKICVKCLACVKTCPYNCISLVKSGITFNYTKCISCFCCRELCPASAIKVKKSLTAKILGL